MNFTIFNCLTCGDLYLIKWHMLSVLNMKVFFEGVLLLSEMSLDLPTIKSLKMGKNLEALLYSLPFKKKLRMKFQSSRVKDLLCNNCSYISVCCTIIVNTQ